MIPFLLASLTVSACNIKNCETCSYFSPSTCANCLPGFHRDLTKGCKINLIQDSSPKAVENCLSEADGLCIVCSPGYFVYLGRCEAKCDASCQCFYPNTCINQPLLTPTQIDSIEPDFSLKACNIKGCTACNQKTKKCTECSSGYSLQNGDCIKCSSSMCKNCENNPNICETCQKGAKLLNGICYNGDCKTAYCSSCSGSKCYSCVKGFYLSNSICIPDCAPNCINCVSQSQVCLICEDNFFPDNGQCSPCIKHCPVCSSFNTCDKCAKGYSYESSGKCEKDSSSSSGSGSSSSSLFDKLFLPIIIIVPCLLLIAFIYWRCKKSRIARNRTTFESVQSENESAMIDVDPRPITPNAPTAPTEAMQSVAYSRDADLRSDMGKIVITQNNFNYAVRKINLDHRGKALGQSRCLICEQEFDRINELGVLPCNHAFHFRCIYDMMIMMDDKRCVVCNEKYCR